MDKVGGAFESLTGTGDNTTQSQSTTGGQTQQQPSTAAGGVLGTLGDKLSSVVGRGGEGENTEGVGEMERASENADTVEQAKDVQIEEFIRHQYKSSPGDGTAEAGKK